jgi:hypothetical protein
MKNYARCAGEIKFRIAIADEVFKNKKNIFTSKLDLNVWKKLVMGYMFSIDFYGAETLTLRKVEKKCSENFEMCCWRRMEKVTGNDCLRNEVLHRVKKKKKTNTLYAIKGRKTNLIGHIWLRNCLLKHISDGEMEEGTEVTVRKGSRIKKLLEIERGSNRWPSTKNLLCKRL